MSKLSHFDAHGQAHMVDISEKGPTHRVAIASGRIEMQTATWDLVASGNSKKGDVLGIARIAGIQAAKKTPDLIPLCHPISLSRVAVDFEMVAPTPERPAYINCRAMAETVGATGVEMEALNAVTVALLTIYDMCKAVDKGMVISSVKLIEKRGGNSGVFLASLD